MHFRTIFICGSFPGNFYLNFVACKANWLFGDYLDSNSIKRKLLNNSIMQMHLGGIVHIFIQIFAVIILAFAFELQYLHYCSNDVDYT